MTPTASQAGPVHVLRIMLGAILAAQFFDNLSHANFSPAGFRRLAEEFSSRNTAPELWNDVARAIGRQGQVLGPIQGASEGLLALALLIGIGWGFAALAFAGLLVPLTLTELGIYWPWELPPLIIVSLALAWYGIADHRRRGLRARPDAGGVLARFGVGGRALLGVLTGVGVGGYLAAAAVRTNIWMPAGIAIALALLLHVALDTRASARVR